MSLQKKAGGVYLYWGPVHTSDEVHLTVHVVQTKGIEKEALAIAF